MADSGQLLRMLEPAVRPITSPGGGAASPANVPIEQQSFESLLAAVQSPGAGADAGAMTSAVGEAAPKQAGPLGPLSQVDAIENASLRALIGRSNGTLER